VTGVLPASCRPEQNWITPARCWQHVYALSAMRRTGVNSVFAGQWLNAENRGGPQSVATGPFTPLKHSCGCRTISVHGRQKFLFIKRTGGSKTVQMILTMTPMRKYWQLYSEPSLWMKKIYGKKSEPSYWGLLVAAIGNTCNRPWGTTSECCNRPLRRRGRRQTLLRPIQTYDQVHQKTVPSAGNR